jgi:ATP-binding cassette subfamily B protein
MLQLRARDERDGEGIERSALHALVAVAGLLGIETSVTQLQRTYAKQGDREPASALLIAMARDLGLDARKITVKWKDLPRLSKSLPAIMRLRDGGAVLLHDVQAGTSSGIIAVVADPLAPPDALLGLDETQLRGVWDGEIILVKRRFAITDEHQPFGGKWLFGQVLRERRLFLDISAAAVISTIFAIAPALIFMVVVNRVIQNRSYSTLDVLVVAIALMILFETILFYLRRILTEVATTRVDGRLNLYIFERMTRLPIQYFEKHPTGMIMSKLAQLWQIRHFLTGQLFSVFLDTVPLLGLIPVMILLEWHLALMVFALSGIVFGIVVAFIRPLGSRYHRVVLAEQAKGSHLVETIYGMRTVKSLAIEGRRRQEWDRLLAEAVEARHDLGIMATYPQTLSLPFERMIYSGSFVVGAYAILAYPNTMDVGALLAFSMLSMRLGQPLIQMARLIQDWAEVRGAIDEVASIMNEPHEQTRTGSGLRMPIRGEIVFDEVRFRYAPGVSLALDNVSFKVEPGMMIGIMGRSGSGKTTVTRLLQGLHPGYEGIVKVDGMDLREIDLTHLRTNIGVVAQENFLFSGSVRNNIGIARPTASFSEIVRAAQLAGAEEFIERMPHGYDTYLEESAANLSGGQRQRLAIARALLVDPPVLILDEATSALDAESEAIINANLQRIARDRTIVCVSHRLSMLVPADIILVMERGRVYDHGRHDELLRRCDIYQYLWQQQNRYADRSSAAVMPLRASDA